MNSPVVMTVLAGEREIPKEYDESGTAYGRISPSIG
jgi:hypothetical protein